MIDWRSTLAVIPARGGSKRLPGKNIKPLGGKLLLDYTAEVAALAAPNMPCLLTTDDPAIAEHGRKLGWLVPFLRPAHLASDTASTVAAVLHALDWYSAHAREPMHLMLLQPTSPFREASCLARSFACLDRSPPSDAVVGMVKVDRQGPGVFQTGVDGFIIPHSGGENGGSGTEYGAPNGAMYLIRTQVFRNEKTFYPKATRAMFMSVVQSLDIDTEDDWRLAEEYVKSRSVDGSRVAAV